MASRRSGRILSTLLIVAGIGLVSFPLFRILYTGWLIGPAQAEALAAWEERAGGATDAAAVAPGATPPTPGLLLSIPRLKLTRVVPEGASVAQLKRYGLGRISWTVLPDRPGLVGIAGHRTTYGAPFFRLGKLARGDQILLTYRGARFDYVVTERRVVGPHQVGVLQAAPGESRIALVTCTPVYSAKYRLVVLGTLRAVTSSTPTP